ncbi:MAG: HU family DNA-binding protein [Rhodobacter sp.]|jgi:DNA-binding protein HU-alpha|nr:HU family DNA-binding protein [Rhodobacter sp.]MBK8441052.1 HU family DNA-binding protein [Rhodobacter sp.]
MATARKPTTAGKSTAAPSAAADTGETPAVREKAPTLRIRDLVTKVTEVSGAKKKDVRQIVEATLTVLGDALARGDDMNLPGFGRTRIARTAERDGASHMTLKVRRGPHRPKAEKEPLADEEDDG